MKHIVNRQQQRLFLRISELNKSLTVILPLYKNVFVMPSIVQPSEIVCLNCALTEWCMCKFLPMCVCVCSYSIQINQLENTFNRLLANIDKSGKLNFSIPLLRWISIICNLSPRSLHFISWRPHTVSLCHHANHHIYVACIRIRVPPIYNTQFSRSNNNRLRYPCNQILVTCIFIEKFQF